MNQFLSKSMIIIFCCLFLTGCWDQLRLKDTRLVDGLGIDVNDDGKVLATAAFSVNTQEGGTAGRPTSTTLLMSSTGNTLRQIRSQIDKELSGNYAPSKIRIILLGEELAKTDIYPYLDVFYRDPRNSLGAFVLISKGTANGILNLKKANEVQIPEAILDLARNAESNTIVKNETIQSLCPTLFDKGRDLGLPYIEKTKSGGINIKGIALFNAKKFSGTVLTGEDPVMLMLLNDDLKTSARFTFKVNPKEKEKINQYVNIQITSVKRDLKLNVKGNKLESVDLSLHVRVMISEYPRNVLSKKSEIKRLNQEITKQLNEKAVKVVNKLQKSNCDYFGIGRRVMAFHPDVWKSIEWKKEYPSININTKIKTEIRGTGIIK
jgi:spore germination protein KC